MHILGTSVHFAWILTLIFATTVLGGKTTGNNHKLSSQTAETEQNCVSIDPKKTSLNTGKDTKFTCKACNNTEVYWINPNGTVIQEMNHTRFNDTKGQLTITMLRTEDTGNYTCMTIDQLHNATAHLNVYVMPDYFLASMIVVAINVALAVLFFGCLIYKTIQGRREANKYKKYKEASGVEITINDGAPKKPHNKHLDIQ